MNVAKPLRPITLEEFEALEKDERKKYELINGIAMMSPSPSKEHQWIGMRFILKLSHCLENTSCYPIYELDLKYDAENWLQPDLMVFCENDEEIPKIVIEILSPSTKHRDLGIKVIKYEEIGIWEYWTADPKTKNITVHDYKNSETETYILGETIQSKNISEIQISVDDIFKLWNKK